jgi:hypothetical protein
VISQNELDREISNIIDERLAAKQVTSPTWLTNQIVANHDEIQGDDSDWYRFCAWQHVRDSVQKNLRRFKIGEEENDRQLRLPGYERVQAGYLVQRSGEWRMVPTEQLTANEIDLKIAELQSMAAGCLDHARELTRYRATQFSGQRTLSEVLPRLSVN